MPIVDDTDNKIRRNLLAVSSLVLIVFFLSLSEEALLKKLLYKDLNIQTWKVLFLELALLIYFLFRFRFSKAFEEAWQFKGAEFGVLRQDALRSYIQKLVKNYADIRSNPSVFNPTLSSTYWKYREYNQDEFPTKFEFKNLCFEYIEPTSDWSGKVHVKLLLAKDGNKNLPIKESLSTGYYLGTLDRFYIFVEAYIKYFFYSKSSITLFVPLTLSIAAFLSILYRSLLLPNS